MKGGPVFIQEDLIFIVSWVLVRRHKDSVYTWRKEGGGAAQLRELSYPTEPRSTFAS